MKSVLVLCLCYVVSSQANENVTKAKTDQLECIDETKVDADLVVQFNAGSIWKKNYPALKKWVLCMMRKSELMSAQGVFQMDVALKRLPETGKSDAEKLIDDCLTTMPLPPEEIAWKYIKCVHERDQILQFPNITLSSVYN